jgi:hypothetical protein
MWSIEVQTIDDLANMEGSVAPSGGTSSINAAYREAIEYGSQEMKNPVIKNITLTARCLSFKVRFR